MEVEVLKYNVEIKEPGFSVTQKSIRLLNANNRSSRKRCEIHQHDVIMTSITGLQTLFSCIFSSVFIADIKEINICWKDMPGASSIMIFVRKDGLVKIEKIPPRK